MGVSISEYKAILAAQGKQIASGSCAGSRMSAAEYQRRSKDGSLNPVAKTTVAAASPKAAKTVAAEPDLAAPAANTEVPRKRIAQPEFESQCALFEWARNPAVIRQYPAIKLMSCSLNGVKLTRSQAGKAKAAGMLKGESDVRLPVARGKWIGLIIEMKAGKNTATQEQLDYGKDMEDEGHQFHICYSWEVAKSLVEQYLQLTRPHLKTGT